MNQTQIPLSITLRINPIYDHEIKDQIEKTLINNGLTPVEANDIAEVIVRRVVKLHELAEKHNLTLIADNYVTLRKTFNPIEPYEVNIDVDVILVGRDNAIVNVPVLGLERLKTHCIESKYGSPRHPTVCKKYMHYKIIEFDDRIEVWYLNNLNYKLESCADRSGPTVQFKTCKGKAEFTLGRNKYYCDIEYSELDFIPSITIVNCESTYMG